MISDIEQSQTQFHQITQKKGNAGFHASESQGFPSMKTDNNSLGTNIAALLRNACIGFRPYTLADCCIEDI